MRNVRLSQFGGRVDHYVSCSVFERLLFLPPLYTERSAVSSQVARLKDFENVREFFTGPLATLFFEMPLVFVYLVVMGFLAHWLVLIPFVLLLAYGVLLSLMHLRLRENSQKAAATGSARQEFLMESVAKMRDIRLAGMESVWNDRYRIISGNASLASFKSSHTAQIVETFSYVLMSLGGIAMLGFGVTGVIEGSLTVGALISAMMLVWRIIAPMQICCASITRLQQLRASVKQVKRLLSLQPEHVSYTPTSPIPRTRGQITFHRVSLRYSPDSEPALLGVSLEIQPGQIVAVRGSNGSGKSTILKLILGLYRPQNGSVRIDGVDIRQYDPIALRQMISYVPQNVDLFPGTIRENLLFANPSASEDQCYQALDESCALQDIKLLPQELDTMVEGAGAENISFLLKQRINMARAYLRPAAIMLFDEASHSLGPDNDIAFQRKISSLRGKSTVVLVTHREDHMRRADQLLVMNKGELTHAGLPDQVLTVLRGKL
jgi:ATP-binding cassette subfamily C protein LapB